MDRRFPALALLCWAPLGADAEETPAQWIVVAAPELIPALKPLVEWRKHEGLAVIVVETTDLLTPRQVQEGDVDALTERVHELCRRYEGKSSVLLVGAATVAGSDPAVSARTAVPALPGTAGRMKGEPTDNGFGCLGEGLQPSVAVGRFPARTLEEASAMVKKTLSFEQDQAPASWRNRLTLLAGNPGGATPIERKFAEWFVQQVAGTRFERVNPLWSGRSVIHAAGSPYCVPDERLVEVLRTYLEEGQVFALYLGHSGPAGLW